MCRGGVLGMLKKRVFLTTGPALDFWSLLDPPGKVIFSHFWTYFFDKKLLLFNEKYRILMKSSNFDEKYQFLTKKTSFLTKKTSIFNEKNINF